MMLRPSTGDIIQKGESPYSLVIAVAKRAREISDEIDENKLILEEKPVKTAVDEFAEKKYVFVPHGTIVKKTDKPLENIEETITPVNTSNLFQPAPEKPPYMFQPPPAEPILPFQNN